MIPFLKELTKEFKKVCEESYLEINTADEVKYPYLTFSYSGEALENTREGFYIDVDIFDNCGADTLRLEQLTEDIKKHFLKSRILTDKVLLQFKVSSRRMIPTTNKQIKRRWLQLYCKVDWRE
ncbi:hypothetical protein [Clostridium botulinum]|uniref:Uncharacterized protein n=1 Tax=Clostridium botulinum TaxID=1491 RepID=A0A9Q1ZD44_CLOBO|nr:hypothetical protein [Clostridium botulinum]AEB75900.1 conserved hypothetical protein [Clostridium botulinum BKT015925]KEH97212.1 hypothetical protein Z953_02665 [Clostridium botulinum D str. 16868]KEI04678.1 hypothetical protein Y848_00485 [Clostridium botulinum C/D str. Sp77]KLU76771.1 hypothetical protein CBC3_01890 [Clostridium botulinum V891]KOA75202.1 hypothetical protein ADU78_08420 [Clostridium botulinum]